MRDRLIQLILECSTFTPEYAEQARLHAEYVAQHLLNEGVIVPPVALGSKRKLYYPVKGTTTVLETKVYGIGIDEDGDVIFNPTEYPEKVIEMRGVSKSIFLTREEAQKALAERGGDGN